MKVQIDICERRTVENTQGEIDFKHYRLYSEIENWDICETTTKVFNHAQKEYGRCRSKIYVDRIDGTTKHIGWVFEKRIKYADCNETYLQETWIVPLSKHEVKTNIEYAL